MNKKFRSVLVLGLSKSGVAAAKYLRARGAEVFLSEKRAAKPEDFEIIEELTGLGIKVETGGHEKVFARLSGAPAAVKPVLLKTNGVPEFNKISELKDWITGNLPLPGDITVKSNGRNVQFSKGSISRSLKGIQRNEAKKQSYIGLKELVESSYMETELKTDKRHQNVKGQELYYNAMIYNDVLYGVEIAVDIPKNENSPQVYAGHKIKIIKTPPAASGPGSNETVSVSPDNTVSITDIAKKINPDIKFCNNFDLAVTSPGIPPHSEIIRKIRTSGIPLISEVELAYLNGGTWIAITGTNGKTTTTALTAHILDETPCGNYGLPPSSLLEEDRAEAFRVRMQLVPAGNEPQKTTWRKTVRKRFVCECSSYQLEMSPSFTPKIAVWTTFAPDHLEWHGGLENYFNAKAKMFRSPQFAVLNATDKRLAEFAETANCGGEIFFFGEEKGGNCCYVKNDAIFYKHGGPEEEIIQLKDCPLLGEHNYRNIECAVICAKIEGISTEKIRKGIMSFTPPEHRMEKFASFDGIDFYNDSKATNPEAAIVAIKSFNSPLPLTPSPSEGGYWQNVVLIAGGRDKNTDLTEFCNEIKKHITTVVLLGEAAARFEENLRANGFTNIKLAPSVEAAVDISMALNPDVVLLSPACASFDMYSGYKERGKVFKEYVQTKKHTCSRA